MKRSAIAFARGATVAIKTTSRGRIVLPGPALTYSVLPLSATAEQAILPR